MVFTHRLQPLEQGQGLPSTAGEAFAVCCASVAYSGQAFVVQIHDVTLAATFDPGRGCGFQAREHGPDHGTCPGVDPAPVSIRCVTRRTRSAWKRSLFSSHPARNEGVQETEPFQSLLSTVMQGLDSGDPRA